MTTQIINDIGTVDMRSIICSIRAHVLPNAGYIYKLRYLGENIWTLRVSHPNAQRSARIEIIVDEFEHPEERGSRGAVFQHGNIPREHVRLLMESIMERL